MRKGREWRGVGEWRGVEGSGRVAEWEGEGLHTAGAYTICCVTTGIYFR